jgi:regulator of PEP synthase PpsR (kinase-PPPase family)
MKKKGRPSKTPPSGGKTIYLLAEGTGETISKIANAALAQFKREELEIKKYFQVASKEQIRDIVAMAAEKKAMVAFSIVESSLGDFLLNEAGRTGIQAFDVIGDFIVQLSMFLGQKPMEIPGGQHILDEAYYRRIEAINFAVKHDDGKTLQGLHLADLVLTGLSRTGKTPLSTYLAHQGWKVANVPLHPDMETPSKLLKLDPDKVFGLMITVENLVRVRESRLEQLGLSSDAKYADPIKIADEIEWCEAFYEQNPGWRIVDISNKAIEEAAVNIVNAFQGERVSPT